MVGLGLPAADSHNYTMSELSEFSHDTAYRVHSLVYTAVDHVQNMALP